MGTIIFTFAALIILIPLLYFLPLGFKKQGKLIIIASSLFLALIGFLANTVFELWQTSLLLLLFALAATYLIEKKLSSFVFDDTSTKETNTGEEINRSDEEETLSGDTKQHDESDTTEPFASLILQEDVSIDYPHSNEDVIEEMKHNEILDEVVSAHTYQQQDANDSILPVEEVLEIEDEHHQEILSESDQETLDNTNDEEHQNLSDLEELVEYNNDLYKDNVELDLNFEEPTTNTSDDNSIVDYNIDEIIEESETQAGINSDISINEIEEVENFTNELSGISKQDTAIAESLDADKADEKAEVNDSIIVEDAKIDHETEGTLPYKSEEQEEANGEGSLIEDNDVVDDVINTIESVNTEVIPEARQVLNEPEKSFENASEGYELVIEPSKENSSATDSIEEEVERAELEESTLVEQESIKDLDLVPEKRKSQFQKQMFHTMVSHLQLSRKYLSVTEYEKRVKDHLHPNLPAQDYYTFSYLLIEHYISEHNERELHSLISHLKDKFTNFVIIQQQLQFLEQHYCKK